MNEHISLILNAIIETFDTTAMQKTLCESQALNEKFQSILCEVIVITTESYNDDDCDNGSGNCFHYVYKISGLAMWQFTLCL